MKDRGALVAHDPDPLRRADLARRVRHAGLRAVDVVSSTADLAPASFDRVLVDAPCSAVGTWRRGPDRRWRLLEAEADAFPALQREILGRAVALLRPGGRLVYATCTLLPAENREVAETVTHLGLAPVAVLPRGPRLGGDAGTLELSPHRHGTDGFFVAAWTRPPGHRPKDCL
jgi:16S rRNA (cytosine967-C5)-methyltransferase